jgi:hypothetical protein
MSHKVNKYQLYKPSCNQRVCIRICALCCVHELSIYCVRVKKRFEGIDVDVEASVCVCAQIVRASGLKCTQSLYIHWLDAPLVATMRKTKGKRARSHIR